jgi:hypothetical protein
LASTACYGDSFTFLYVDDVRTSEETHLLASTACYRSSFTFLNIDDVRTTQKTSVGFHGLLRLELYFLYIDDVRISQETHLWTSTACYRDNFTFLNIGYVRPRPVTCISILSYI